MTDKNQMIFYSHYPHMASIYFHLEVAFVTHTYRKPCQGIIRGIKKIIFPLVSPITV